MLSVSLLRKFVNNGWNIANRRNIISQIGENTFNEISLLATKTGRNGNKVRYCDVKGFLQSDTISETKTALSNTNIAYHGSPFSFNFFDTTKIRTGEGMNKYCEGLYLSRTKGIAPFYANIRSKDAPLHFGSNKPLKHATPTVYEVANIDLLNLKLCSPLEAKKIKNMQAEFQINHPEIDGIELLNGEITVFPKSVQKLSIIDKKGVVDFVKDNKDCAFRRWTTDSTILDSIYGKNLSDTLKCNKVEHEIAPKIEAIVKQDFSPVYAENTAVSMHHDLNSKNTRIRSAIKDRMDGLEGLDDFEKNDVLALEKYMSKVDEEFEKLPPLEKCCIVYRGRSENPITKRFNKDFEIMDNANIGDVVVPDTAYSYTAFKRSRAENWGGEGARCVNSDGSLTRNIMYEIHIPKGAKVSRNGEHGGEVVMPRGAQYIVKDKKVDSEGCMEVVLEYILPKL